MARFDFPDYRIGEQLPKGSAPSLQVDTPLSAFGAPQAEALQQFGKALDKAADPDRVERLINLFIDKKQKALFTGPDAFFWRKGQQAIEAEPPLMRNLAGLRDATLAAAGSDDERALLAPRLDLHIADAMDGVGRHLAAERVTRNRDILNERQALIRRAAELEPD
ncbi:MAG: hypothetical protein J0J01_04975, partial [Reyranella sp.]|uniref:hypothetical protein n=1 Tax=Reyranella sp. TaxID=1929291 RepID=UPI001AD58636